MSSIFSILITFSINITENTLGTTCTKTYSNILRVPKHALALHMHGLNVVIHIGWLSLIKHILLPEVHGLSRSSKQMPKSISDAFFFPKLFCIPLLNSRLREKIRKGCMIKKIVYKMINLIKFWGWRRKFTFPPLKMGKNSCFGNFD